MESNIKNYPVSRQKFKCIGPCYHPGTWIVHPVTLEYTTDKNNPFCPVRQWEYVDKNTNKKISLTTDVCYPPTENKDLSGKEFEINILTPNIDFNDEHFLKIYYNIYSFENAVEFIDTKKYLPLLTKVRIMDCALNAYGNDLNVIDHRTVNFFIQVAESLWINDLYNAINKYIVIKDDKINFDKQYAFVDDNEVDKLNDLNDNNKEIKINYIKHKFINSDNMYKFIIKYLKHRKEKWNDIKNHVANMKNDFIVYIEQKIRLSLDLN